jgi:purine-binding chemotaxis protein CheW
VGSQVCGLPLDHVLETMRPLPVEPLAGMPAFVTGLSLIRGIATPVIDLQTLLRGARDASSPGRLVVISASARKSALAVEDVVGIRTLSSGSLEKLPPILRDGLSEHIEAVGRLDSELLLVLNDSRMLPESAWEALHKEGAS